MSASASSEISDARALQLARIARRSHWAFFVGTTVLPLGVVMWMAWDVHTSEPNWLMGPGVVVLLYLIVVSSVVLGQRSQAKAVEETSLALPDAYFVCQAADTNPNYSPAPTPLVAQASGLSLCNGRGTRLRPVWELEWADIAAAAVVEYTEGHKLDTRPAVRITRRDGQSKLLVLVDKNRRTDALMDFPRHVAALINAHAGR